MAVVSTLSGTRTGKTGHIRLDLTPERAFRAPADDRQPADVESGRFHRLEDVAEGEGTPLEDRPGHVVARVREREPEEDAARGAVPLRSHGPLHRGEEDDTVAPRGIRDASSLSWSYASPSPCSSFRRSSTAN